MTTRIEFLRAQRYFAANPAVDYAYLFFDGRIIPEETFRRRMTSRTAQLVSIALDGFPVLISRHSCDVVALASEAASGTDVRARLARRRLDFLATHGVL
jgi:hypothetical protein